MKKQNPNKLAFNKAAVAELNETQLKEVNGGTITSLWPSFVVTLVPPQLD